MCVDREICRRYPRIRCQPHSFFSPVQPMRDKLLQGQAAHRPLGNILGIQDNELSDLVAPVDHKCRQVAVILRSIFRGALPRNEFCLYFQARVSCVCPVHCESGLPIFSYSLHIIVLIAVHARERGRASLRARRWCEKGEDHVGTASSIIRGC